MPRCTPRLSPDSQVERRCCRGPADRLDSAPAPADHTAKHRHAKGMDMRLATAFLAAALWLAPAFPSGGGTDVGYGISMFGEMKYGPGFTHFEYANPDAPKAIVSPVSAEMPHTVPS